jgi:hypothetical protein
MAYEDFTTYTEVDTQGFLSQTASKATFTALGRRVAVAYLYSDKGAAHFAGDFEHLLTVYISAADSNSACIFNALSTGIGDWGQLYSSAYKTVGFRWFENSGSKAYRLSEMCGSSTIYTDEYAHADNVGNVRYIKFKRVESVGTYGTLYAYIYSDAEMTSLLDTLSLALHSKEDYRYCYVTSGHYTDGSPDYFCTGYVENLDLQEAAAPTQKVYTSMASKMIAAGLL